MIKRKIFVFINEERYSWKNQIKERKQTTLRERNVPRFGQFFAIFDLHLCFWEAIMTPSSFSVCYFIQYFRSWIFFQNLSTKFNFFSPFEQYKIQKLRIFKIIDQCQKKLFKSRNEKKWLLMFLV